MGKICTKSTKGHCVTFDFAGVGALVCDIDALPEAIVRKLALHGLSQKIGDSYAGSESISAGMLAARTTFDNLHDGVWASKSGGGLLAEAVASLKKVDLAIAVSFLADLTDHDKKAIRKHPVIAARMAEITARKKRTAAEASDVPIVLDGLED